MTYSATQYALFSSVMLLLPKFIAGFSSPQGLFYAKLSAASTMAIAPILIMGYTPPDGAELAARKLSLHLEGRRTTAILSPPRVPIGATASAGE